MKTNKSKLPIDKDHLSRQIEILENKTELMKSEVRKAEAKISYYKMRIKQKNKYSTTSRTTKF